MSNMWRDIAAVASICGDIKSTWKSNGRAVDHLFAFDLDVIKSHGLLYEFWTGYLNGYRG